ncbi:MAG: PHP domain-containing protein [Ruminococcaceae bacterium]|nr:PHP domain-containing protein [Oscillospiraceae bacterium]
MKYANLHLHSTFSDGTHTPDSLCRKLVEMGYAACSLTDHQTASGCRIMAETAKKYGLDFIPGMEVYGRFDRFLLHLTGYDFDVTHPAMAEFLRINEESAYRATKARFEACIAEGMFGGITWQNVLDVTEPGAWMCNEQVFLAMVKFAGLTQKDYWQWIAKYNQPKVDEPVLYPFPAAEEMITLIRNAGGVPCVAHPHGQTHLLPALYKAGLMGAEYDHPDIDGEDSAAVVEFAKTHKFYLTGGTDHTGITGNNMIRGDLPNRSTIGFIAPLDADVRCGVTQEQFELLKTRELG